MNLRHVSTRMLLKEVGERLDFGAACDVNYASPGLHGLIDELPESWTPERRAEWLKAVETVVDLEVDLEVKVLPSPPVGPQEEKL